MKTTVIFSTNESEIYKPFAEPVSKAWQNLGFETMCVSIDEHHCYVSNDEIPTANQSQMIRLLLPSLYPEMRFIVSDIDMLPLNKNYFHQASQLVTNKDHLVNISADAYPDQKRLPICYFIGYGSVFSKITGVKSYLDISRVMREWWSEGHGWATDELVFTSKILDMLNKKDIDFSGYARGWTHGMANYRIDRSSWRYNKDELSKGSYIDSHMLRPLNINKDHLRQIFHHVGVDL